MIEKREQNSWGRDLVVLAAALAVLYGVMLGSRPLSVPDEGRYAEISREMAVSGDYITPRLNGVKYFEKPPLFYWLEAATIRLFGPGEWPLRFWPALFALFGCLFIYIAGRRLFGRRAGLLSAAVLATTVLYYALSRAIILDMPVTVLLSGGLLSFLLGIHESEERKRRWYFWGFYVFAALATLTKGLIGIVIPGMIIGAWMLILNEWRILKSMRLVSGMAIFLLIAAPWHIAVEKANPEFFRFYFYHEHFERYLTKVHGRYKPFWYFVPVLLGGMYPSSVFLVQSVRHSLPRVWSARKEHREAIFLVLWAGLTFLFFSASDSKLMPYVLPVFPPLAILIGRYLADAWDSPELPGFKIGIRLLLIASLLLAAALIIAPHYRGSNTTLHTLRLHLYLLALIILGSAHSARWIAGRHGFGRAFSLLIGGTAFFLMLSNAVAPEIDNRPVNDLAMTLKQRLRPGDEVMSYENYYQDLPVYLERRITVVNWKGELTFGSTVEDTSAWMINEKEFRKRWRGANTSYLLTDLKTYDILRKELKLYPVARNQRTVLVCNKEVKP